MSRAQRLLDLLHILRGYQYPLSGHRLAEMTGVSLRTLYRDIATLQQQGANIEGEAGIGYLLRPGYILPPLMFTAGELEALVLGCRWVASQDDRQLTDDALSALNRITAVLPVPLQHTLNSTALLIGPGPSLAGDPFLQTQIRQAIREEKVIILDYCDSQRQLSQRRVWPFALGYFNQCRVLAAWCETRQAFRHFRTDRISSLQICSQRFPRSRQQLLKQWRKEENIPPQLPGY